MFLIERPLLRALFLCFKHAQDACFDARFCGRFFVCRTRAVFCHANTLKALAWRLASVALLRALFCVHLIKRIRYGLSRPL